MKRVLLQSFFRLLGVGALVLGLSSATFGKGSADPSTGPFSELATASEMSAQHFMLKTDIADTQSAIAEVKALVEALEPGVAVPPCGAGTEGQRFVEDAVEVCDNDTGLFWVRAPDKIFRNHTTALSHCAGLALGNSQTYRLPDVKELISVIDYSQSIPALTLGHPFSNIESVFYWSASSAHDFPGSAWSVDGGFGFVAKAPMSNTRRAWCVRSST